jgi:hypothetical protein
LATASTLGYGDETVDKENSEYSELLYIFAIVIILLALNYFAYMQSLIWSTAQDWTKIDGDFVESLEEFEDWMAIRNQTIGSTITFHFEKSCKIYIKYMSNRDVLSKVNYMGYMDAMAFADQNVVKRYVTRELIESFEFFASVSFDTGSELCTQYLAQKYSELYLVLCKVSRLSKEERNQKGSTLYFRA